MFQAGAGTSVITAPLGTPVAGLFEKRAARSVHDELLARTLVLDDGVTRVALVVCDLESVKRDVFDRAKDLIAERTGIPAAHVMVSATHSHTTPVAWPYFGYGPDPDYLAWLPSRIADAVVVAVDNLEAATIAIGGLDVPGVCFNRRYHMRDGTVVMNPGVGNSDIVMPAGPVDPEVTALLVTRPDSTPIALWANLGLHYVGTEDDLVFSADYYGEFADFIATAFGSSCTALLTNGASGDINNIDTSGGSADVPAIVKQRRVAAAVGGAAVAATRALVPTGDAALAARVVPFDLRRYPVTAKDLAVARQMLASRETALDGPSAGSSVALHDDGASPLSQLSLEFSFVTGQPIPEALVPTYAAEVLALAELPAHAPTLVQFIQVGQLTLVAVPGEIFAEHGLVIKAAHPRGRVAVVGLANDFHGYLPPERALAQGGYETWASRTAAGAPGTGDEMVELIIAELNSFAEASRHPE